MLQVLPVVFMSSLRNVRYFLLSVKAKDCMGQDGMGFYRMGWDKMGWGYIEWDGMG